MTGVFLLLLLALPFAGSLATSCLPRRGQHMLPAWLAVSVAASALAVAAGLYPFVRNGGVVRLTLAWLPELGLNFALRMDGFAWLFSIIITLIGVLVVVYARYYISTEDPIARFFSLLLAFMGAMLGFVLSGNLILLSIFWELTSLFSFLLIGYWHHNANARDGARMALTVTGIGGFCLLAGVLVIGHIVGSYDLDTVLTSGDLIRGHDLYLTALILILIGALTKSAQFPFHFWLPNAMAAPTPVSAYLHSATMVKAGVFLLARLWPALSGTYEWFWLLGFCGIALLAGVVLIGQIVGSYDLDVVLASGEAIRSHVLYLPALVLILLSIFWELTSLFSFLLIGYWHHNANARDGARMALTVTGIGGFCLLAGVLVIGHIVGSYDLDTVLASGDLIRGHNLYLTALVLILIGALTKSAQFPFHFWLPNAMAAPTPVSAYLHSATMVKAGVFLLARLWPALSGTYEWFWLLGFCGIATLLLGAYFAMFQQDLKGLLAYSTISHLGLIATLLSLGSPLAAVAAVFHMLNMRPSNARCSWQPASSTTRPERATCGSFQGSSASCRSPRHWPWWRVPLWPVYR